MQPTPASSSSSKPEVVVHPIPFPLLAVKQCSLRKVSLFIQAGRIVNKSALETVNGNIYEIGRILKDAIYGHVYHAVLLHRYQRDSATDGDVINASNDTLYKRAMPLQQVAMKVISKERIREYQGKTQEDPIKELSSMQYLGEHPNIMSQIECVEDRDNIYSIMPFCDGGELYDLIETKGAMTEEQAKYYFVQILQGVAYLQYKGVAHRDLSLENIMFDSSGKCFIIDFGMCIRIPLPSVPSARSPSSSAVTSAPGTVLNAQEQQINELNRIYEQQLQLRENLSPPPPPPACGDDEMMDVDNGTTISSTNSSQQSTITSPASSTGLHPLPIYQQNVSSVLSIKIPCQGVCGKRNYIAPEVLDNSAYFEPFNVDIWALGVILFIMLTGVPPVDTATSVDQRYRLICAGFLSNMLEQWGITMSSFALDLIKRIMKPVPGDRLTLHEILHHPWITNVSQENQGAVAVSVST